MEKKSPNGLSTSSLSASSLGKSIDSLQIDADTRDLLVRCNKALNQIVGPIARVFLREGVVALSQSGEFNRGQIPQLIKILEKKIEGEPNRAAFREAAKNI